MDNTNMDKALEIFSILITGGSISNKENSNLYEDYCQNGEVYDIVEQMLERLNLSMCERANSLTITTGENNRVFGYTNEELKKELGVRLNKELYLAYFIIYNVITSFYKDSSNYTFREYVKLEDVMTAVDKSLKTIIDNVETMEISEAEENSFNTLAQMWDDMPIVIREDNSQTRAAKSSKLSFVKRVFNFLTEQRLFINQEERYYCTDRFKAIIEDYFEKSRSRLYEIILGQRGEE